MGPVEEAIRARFKGRATLYTLSQNKPFVDQGPPLRIRLTERFRA